MADEPYFTVAELRARQNMEDTGRYTDARMAEVRSIVETIIERTVGTSFVNRSRTGTLTAGYGTRILHIDPWAQAVTSVTAGGVAFTADQLARLVVSGGHLAFSDGTYWPVGTPIVVTYTARYSAVPPPDIKEAALEAARLKMPGTHGDRAMPIPDDYEGDYRARVVATQPFGDPDIDNVIQGWAGQLQTRGQIA